ncbi:hypothetical protein LR48_Vigan233s001400 [Vigna angularis]|uniref:Uncharacterized protein n=1 Tax=Phaseolus angularis TaxID=3914 RepID=A0A0L9T6D6_PHAAN|nr:hypothetical protein LR48_Vigan233s001400 [Vigna angularis]
MNLKRIKISRIWNSERTERALEDNVAEARIPPERQFSRTVPRLGTLLGALSATSLESLPRHPKDANSDSLSSLEADLDVEALFFDF